jgi:hypothetical protein
MGTCIVVNGAKITDMKHIIATNIITAFLGFSLLVAAVLHFAAI